MARGHLKTIERQGRKRGRTSRFGSFCLYRGIEQPECSRVAGSRKLIRQNGSKTAREACFSLILDLTSKRGKNSTVCDMRLRGVDDRGQDHKEQKNNCSVNDRSAQHRRDDDIRRLLGRRRQQVWRDKIKYKGQERSEGNSGGN